MVTINVDEDITKVDSFVRERSYTFPVLLGKKVMDSQPGSWGIPQMLARPRGRYPGFAKTHLQHIATAAASRSVGWSSSVGEACYAFYTLCTRSEPPSRRAWSS